MKQPELAAGRPARMTPFELVFGATDFDVRIFPALREQAAAYGVDATHPDRFNFLPRAAEVVRELVPPEAPPDAHEQYRALLYHAYNFWADGHRVYLAEPAVLRYLIEAAPALDGWELMLPGAALYLQLPANLFWASVSQHGTPEPVDGVFVTAAQGADPLGVPYRQLELLLVLGIRRDRAGFSIIPFSTEVGPGIAQEWADAPGRDDGPDFANVLPGGDLAGLYSIVTAAEALKLVARVLWYVETHADAVQPDHAVERRRNERPGAPPVSALPFLRVTLTDEMPAAGGEAADAR